MSNSNQPSQGRPAASDDGRNPIDVLADSFLSRLRRGEYPSVGEYALQHPELADEIRSVFPTLARLEKGGEGITSPPAPLTWKSNPRQIGEYEILREVGRGGMGVVYEAEHETMRRRVALKVLPVTSAADDVHLQRFYLEARAAGRLHHTNIVPVFEVGTDGEYHYYAMQFIQGQNLDVVIDELRRIQGAAAPSFELPTEASPAGVHDVGKDVAMSLVSGQFARQDVGQDEVASSHAVKHGEPYDVTIVAPAHMEIQSSADTAEGPCQDVFAENAKTDTQDGQRARTSPSVTAKLNNSTDTRDDYFRRVARISLQVAEALSYAHGQGILHRDIKPSNIILDTAGVAWVADFGLAKDEDGDLTRSGDILGTFRYMAPERFDGHSDARSDVYGLGLTLYELCTLRSAFRETDRARLVREVCDVEPTKPRNYNPEIPRDLETIILKAIEKRPSSRYQAARHLAEDLRLFLADHPIRARRVSASERVWRWCRRNPQQASLVACVLLLLCIVTVGSLAFGYLTARQSEDLAASKQIATERLYQSLRGNAEALRWSGRPGQHFASLEQVASAVEILPQLGLSGPQAERELVELRNAAIAAMPLPDVRPVKSWAHDEPWSDLATFHPNYTLYARVTRGGDISIRNVEGDEEQFRLATPEMEAEVLQMQFSPNGRYLAVNYRGKSGQSFYVWDTPNAEAVVALDLKSKSAASFDFEITSAWIAFANGRTLTVAGLPDGGVIRELPLAGVARDITVSPLNGHVAVLLWGVGSVQVWQSDTWQRRELESDIAVWAFAWHPRSGELALGGDDGSLLLHRLSEEAPQVRKLEGHTARVKRLRFSPSGDMLVSQAWDGTTRLWQSDSGKQLLRMEGLHLLRSGFSRPDGRFLGMRDGSRFQIWEVNRETPLQILSSPGPTSRRWSVDIGPDGRWLASARDDGVEIWDMRSARRVRFLSTTPLADGSSKDAEFLPDGSGLLTSNTEGVRIYPIEAGDEPGSPPRFLSPRVLHPRQTTWLSLNSTGTFAAFRSGMRSARGVVASLADPSSAIKIGPHPGIDHVEISPNGRWVATTTWGGRGIHVWDAQTGERITKQPLEPSEAKTNVVFGPDSKRLAASTPQHHVAWNVESLELIYRVPRDAHDEWPGPVAYSPDGTILAAAHSRFVLALLDAQTGKQIGVVGSPGNAGFHACCFSPDGSILAASSDTDIHLWNLAAVRRHLSEIHLDFQLQRTKSL